MANFLKKLLSSSSMTPTADGYRRLQSDAEKRVERDTVAEANAWRGYDESLLDEDPAATTRARQKAQDATDARARSEAQLAAIRAAFLKACETEAEQDRRANYEFALAEIKRGKPIFRDIEKDAFRIAQKLPEIARIELAIARANADLPTGAEPLVGLEQSVRGLPAIQRRTISENVTVVWVFADWPEAEVEPDKIKLIKSDDGIHGEYVDPYSQNSTVTTRVLKRRKIVREVQPGAAAWHPTPLAGSISLPGLLPGSRPIWKPVGGDPMYSTNNPRDVLAAAEVLSAPAGAPTDPRAAAGLIQPWPDETVEWQDVEPGDADDAAIIAATSGL